MKRKKFALIWWLNSSYKDVVELSTFPAKHRQVNAVSNLTWMNHETGFKTKAEAKILAISEDKTALDLMFVPNEGELLDPAKRVFSKEAIDQKTSCDQENKLKKKMIKSSKRQFESELMNQSSIFPDCQLPPKKKMDTKISDNLAHQKAAYLDPQPSTAGSSTSYFTRPPFNQEIHRMERNLQSSSPERSPSFRSPNVMNQGSSKLHVTSIEKNYCNCSLFISSEPRLENEMIDSQIRDAGPGTSAYAAIPGNKPLASEIGLTSKNIYVYEHNKSSDEDNLNNFENWSGAMNAMALTFPGKVTARDIVFQTFLLESMKQAYKSTHSMETSNQKFELPSHYLQPAPNMQEIVDNCGFFLPKNIIAYINTVIQTDPGVEDKDKWKILVRETLLEVYGETIANHSARGKRGKKPPINPLLLKGLFQWACNVSPDIVYKDFIKFINKFAGNKRRYQELIEKKDEMGGPLKKKNPSSRQFQFETETRHNQQQALDSSKSTPLNPEDTHFSTQEQENAFDLSKSSIPLNVEAEGRMGDGSHLSLVNCSQIGMRHNEQQSFFNLSRPIPSSLEATQSVNETIDWAKSFQPI